MEIEANKWISVRNFGFWLATKVCVETTTDRECEVFVIQPIANWVGSSGVGVASFGLASFA
ncbi:hypothetical protein DS901_04220 [Loktanella sp. D2R18]|nr:hypothetical protein DS901_04220 [Loktanella sp. D2R18]